ncbi:MAG: hypothetical protein E7J70_05795 [Veillonella sp.]|nr:hypothetical protein [Veillonella sp.]
MNKLFRYAAAAVLVASFGMLSDYTADAAKFLESPREVTIVKPELPEIPQTAMVAPDMRVRFLIDKKGNGGSLPLLLAQIKRHTNPLLG